MLTSQKWDLCQKVTARPDKMGKTHKKGGKSRRSRDRGSRKKRSRDSSSSSTDSDSSATMKKQLKMLKKQIDELKNKPSTSSAADAAALFISDEQAIPVFDSSKDDISIETWVTKVDTLGERYKWSDEYIIRIIASRLKGHARQWYYEQTKNDASWYEMKSMMLEHFRKSVPFANLLRDASNYEARPNQNLGDYCFRKLSKLRALKLQIPDECLVDAVIGGINDDNIVRTIRAAQIQTADRLYCYLNTLGCMPGIGLKHKSINFQHKSLPTESQNYNVTQPIQFKTQSACYNCGISGHIAKDCRKKTTRMCKV